MRIRDVIGPDEWLLLVALALLTGGLWPLCGVAALISPGMVLLWIALPQRVSFLQKHSTDQPKGRAR